MVTTQPTSAAVRVTTCIGGTVLRPLDDADDLLRRADDSLYLAKRHGGNALAWRGMLVSHQEGETVY